MIISQIQLKMNNINQQLNKIFCGCNIYFVNDEIEYTNSHIKYCDLIIHTDNKNTDNLTFCVMHDNEIIYGEKIDQDFSVQKILIVTFTFEFIFIGFPHDTRVYVIPIDIIKKLPTSSIYSYYCDYGLDYNKAMILDKFDYETFSKVYDALCDPKKLLLVPDNIKALMDEYGLIDNTTYYYNAKLNERKNNELDKFIEFINNPGKILLIDNRNEYLTLKQMFTSNLHIIPIQFIFDESLMKPILVNILDGLPISFYPSIGEANNLDKHFDTTIKHIDINKARRLILFTAKYRLGYREQTNINRELASNPKSLYGDDECIFLGTCVASYIYDIAYSYRGVNGCKKLDAKISANSQNHSSFIMTQNFINLEKYTSEPLHLFIQKIIGIISSVNFDYQMLKHAFTRRDIKMQSYGYMGTHDTNIYTFIGFVHI